MWRQEVVSAMDVRVRFALQAASFLLLTIGGGYWAYNNGGLVPADLEPLRRLPAPTVALIVVLSVGLYVSDAWRFRTAGHAIDVDVSWATAAHASIASNFFSCVTPGAAFGAPAGLVMLARRGVSWELATLIAFGKGTVGSALLQAAAFGFLLLGLGPAALPSGVFGLLVVGIGATAVALTLPLAASVYPEPVRRVVRAIEGWILGHDRVDHSWLGRVTRASLRGLTHAIDQIREFQPSRMPVVLLSQVVYFACFIGLAVVLCVAFGARHDPALWGAGTVYVAFLYVAPTPGGAGLAEGAAQGFFGALLPTAGAVVAVLLFRALTFYLYMVVGVLHVAWVGGLGAILAEADHHGGREGGP